MLRIFSRLNIGGPSVHVILLSAGLRPLGYETRLVVGTESPREGNMLALAAEKNVTCEAMAGLGREIAPLSDLRALVGLFPPHAGLAAGDRPHPHRQGRPPRPARRARGGRPHGRAHVPRPRAARVLLAREDGLLPLARDASRHRRGRARGGLGLGEAGPRGPRHRAGVQDPRGAARPRPRAPRRRAAAGRAAARGGDPRERTARGDGGPPRADQGRAHLPRGRPDRPREARGRPLRPRGGRRGAARARVALPRAGPRRESDVLRLEARPRRGLRRPRRGGERLAQRRDAGRAHRGAGGGAAGRGDPRGRDAGPPGRGRARPARPPGEPEALAEAVLETLTGSEAARRRALAGREHVLARHSSDRLVRDVDALYRELRAAKKAA